MPKILLIRHGHAAAAWDQDHDPGLDAIGHEQARRMARAVGTLGPLALTASPMARTRQTAAALAAVWRMAPRIEPRVSEIPSPVQDLPTRGEWLRSIADRRWSELDAPLQRWRNDVMAALLEMKEDTAVVTHYIAINAVVGVAVGDDRLVNFQPDYCSITTLVAANGGLILLSRGAQSETRVL